MKRRVMLALAGAMVLLTCGAMATEGALAPVLVQQPEEPPGLDDFLQRLPPELQELFRRFFEQQPQQVQPRGRLQFPPVQPVEPAEPEEPPAEPEAPPSAPDLFGRGGNFFFGPNFFFFGPTDPGLLERLFPRAPATPELEDLRSEQQRLLEELNRLEQQLAQRRRQLQEGQPEQPEQPPPEQPQPPAQGGIFLGVRVTTVDDAIREKLGLGAEVSGVVIEVIVPGSPAEQAGLQVDDVIVAVDGQAVASAQEFARQVRVHRPGEQVTFAVLRQGAISTITVTLGQSEQPPQQPPAQPPQGRIPLPQQPAPPTSPAPEQPPVPQRPYLGVNGQTIDEQLRMFFNLPEAGGVLVESVEPGSPAEQAGIRGGNITARVAGRQVTVGGDVITAIDRQRVTSLEQLDQMVRSHQIGDQITVTVLRRGRSLDLAVTLG
ncbi:MAG: PDZ domain-containing protein, partial [Deinococcus sp.]|nr:PDZ domain-containing protein [Deinococcus sp.]